MTADGLHPPTAEQGDVLDLVNAGEHVALSALAGTGKTTTLRHVAHKCCDPSIADRGGVLYAAFNKAIQREAEGLFPSWVECRTTHSLAWSNRYRERLGAKRLSTAGIVSILGAQPNVVYFEDDRDGSQEFPAELMAALAIEAVIKFSRSADLDISEKHMPRVPGLDVAGEWSHHDQIAPDVVTLARRAWWDDITKPSGKLRFEHDYYKKIWHLRLREKNEHLGYEMLFVDEAQDLTPLDVDVFQREAQNGAQVIAVGDLNQQIYGWRGAVDGMHMIEGAKDAQLSWCWRFGEEIAGPVNEMLTRLRSGARIIGKGGPGEVGLFPSARTVLARSNGTIMQEAVRAAEDSVRFTVVGSLAKSIIAFAQGALALQEGRRSTHHELSWANSWPEVMAYVENDRLGWDLTLRVNIVSELGAQRVIDVMTDAANCSEETAELILSTMHVSKGREWPDVRLAGDYRPDEDGAPMLTDEDRRVYYVAASRAQTQLDISACTKVFYGSRS